MPILKALNHTHKGSAFFFSNEAYTLDSFEKPTTKNICEFFLNKTVYNIFDQGKESLGYNKIYE